LTLEIQAPIFVFREWHRHRTFAYNEMSARYSPLPDLNYVPTAERCLIDAGKNRQAQGTGAGLTPAGANAWIFDLKRFYAEAEAMYQAGL
jgi:thymidylate synthase (FAD)